MKRLSTLFVLCLFLVGCATTVSSTSTSSSTSSTTTTSTTSTTSSTSSTTPSSTTPPSTTTTTSSSNSTTWEVSLATPEIFWSAPDTLQWEPIEGAEEYEILANETLLSSEDASVFLGDLPENVFYEVSVRAKALARISPWSEPEEYAKFIPWGNGFDVFYSVLSDDDFSFVLGAELTVLDVRYAEEDVDSGKTNESIVKSLEGNGFSFGKTYVTEAPEGELDYVVYTTLGQFPLSLSRVQQEGPYVVNPSTFHLFGNVPAFFRFDLMGTTFGSLSGNGITEEDYVYEEGMLTISRSFLDPLFEENPTRIVVLGYQLEDGIDSIFGVLIIDRPQE